MPTARIAESKPRKTAFCFSANTNRAAGRHLPAFRQTLSRAEDVATGKVGLTPKAGLRSEQEQEHV